MKILLVDVDSTISNLALMKLARHHRDRGDEVLLYDHRPKGKNLRKTIPLELVGWADRGYVSCVFAWNAGTARKMGAVFQSRETFYGGQGLGVFLPNGEPVEFVKLPPEVDALLPDYSIYPDEEYAVGFCNRGCFRKCGFCSVPNLEGKIRPDRFLHPSVWVPDDRRTALLLDNEFAAYPPGQQRDVLRWFTDAGVRFSITQGIDLRVVARNRSLAELYAANKPWSNAFTERLLYCAWDNPGDEDEIRRGIGNLLAAGFTPREVRCYELVGFNTDRKWDLHRFHILWDEYGIRPFVMKFNNRRDDPWMNHFARYVNRPAYRNLDWWDYEYAGFRAADHPVAAP